MLRLGVILLQDLAQETLKVLLAETAVTVDVDQAEHVSRCVGLRFADGGQGAPEL